MTDDMKEARERARKRAAEREHNAYMMDRYHELDRIKKEAEDKKKREQAEKEAALKRKVAEKLALEARPHKLFVAGDPRGHLEKLFSTAQAQAAKVGGIEALICVGRLLPDEAEGSMLAYLRGEKKPPLETFFIDTSPALLQAAPLGRTLCENLHFLGGYGVKMICGLRVAFLSGYYDPERYSTPDVDFVGGAFTARAVNNLRRVVAEDKWRRGVDLLLTTAWPSGLDQKLEEPAKPGKVAELRPWQDAAAPPLAELCCALEPRYHLFGTADIFYQRPPFKAPRREHACRCVGLGYVASKRKWLHALSLSPMDCMKKEDLRQLPTGTTACPFPRKEMEAPNGQEKQPASFTKDEALGELALEALKNQDNAAWQLRLQQLKDSLVWVGNANTEPPAQARKKARVSDEPDEKRLEQSLASPGTASPVSSKEDEDDDETPEAMAARQVAQENLSKPPKKGIVRYTFRDEGLLGIRLSRDVPPWILEVRDGTLAARKAPKVPVGGVLMSINGYDLSVKENPNAVKALAKRPVVLDIDWPIDVPMPSVSSA